MIRHYFIDKFGFEKALLDLGGQTLLAEVPEDKDFAKNYASHVASLMSQ